MGPLKKLIINTDKDIIHATEPIQSYVCVNKYKGFIMTNAFDKIITNPKAQFISQEFNGSIIFISAQSFQQNNQALGNQIRKYVKNLVTHQNKITCIGGEAYLYGLTGLIPNVHVYTNSSSIYEDIEFNTKFFHSNCIAELCDYNKINQIEPSPVCLINLSNLNVNLVKLINTIHFDQIIIISCHHDDFWKKLKYLSCYKVILRKQFVAYTLGYFLTVNVLFKFK